MVNYRDRFAQYRFEAPQGIHIHRYMHGVMIDFDSPLYSTHWWSEHYQKWMHQDEIDKGGYGSHYGPCRTFRAFERHLRRHPEMIGHLRLCCRKRYHFEKLNERFGADIISLPILAKEG